MDAPWLFTMESLKVRKIAISADCVMGIKKKPTTNYDDPVNYSAGEYNAVSPTLNDGDVSAFQFDSAGNLLTKQVNAGSGSNPAAGATGSAVPADADYQGVSVGGTLTGVTGLSVGTKVAPTVAIVDASGNQITAFGGSGGNAAAGATAAAVPADADYVGFNSGGNLVGVSSSNPLPVSLANTGANATAVKVDGSGVTQPVSGTFWQATQPVSGTVTANIGTSGSLALDASVTGLVVAQASTTSGQKGHLVQGAVTTAAPSYTTAQTDPLSLDTSGNLRVSLKDSPANTNKFLVTADPITFASAQAVTQSGTWTVQPGNTANTTPWLVQTVGGTSGGLGAPFSASQTSTKGVVKASAGTLYGYEIVNNGSALCYIQVFNKLTANVTVGTTAPDWVIPIPAPSSGTAGAGIVHELDKGYSFSIGLVIACTTTRTGGVSATCDVNFFFD